MTKHYFRSECDNVKYVLKYGDIEMNFDMMNSKIDKLITILRKTFGDMKQDEYHKFDFRKTVEMLIADCDDIEFEDLGYAERINLIFNKPLTDLNYNITTDIRYDRCGFVFTRHEYDYNKIYQRWFLSCGYKCIMILVKTTCFEDDCDDSDE